ncbi:MAG: hypothetical protein QOD99_471, partial [Chthoniobacter sp.]|nr:hypothetical protein [Chthoniobacter sp.]
MKAGTTLFTVRAGDLRWICVLGLFVFSAAARAQDITYAENIRPLFQSSCLNCHNADKHKAGLDLSTYEAAMEGSDGGKIIEPGNPAKSLLYRVITYAEEPAMPAKADKLPDSQIEMIRKWIEMNAPEKSGNAVAKNAGGLEGAPQAAAEERPKTVSMPRDLLLESAVHARRPGAINALAASRWAPLIAVAGQKQVLLFNTDTLELAGVLPFPEGFPDVLKFSRDGQLLLAGGGLGAKLGRVVVWDVITGRRMIEAGDEFDAVLAADISADHSLIALGGPNKLVKIFSARDGSLLHKMKKHTDWVTALSFTPDGKSLVSGDRAGGLVVWDRDGRELQSISAHKGMITSVACAGNLVASASEDGTVKLWDIREGRQTKSWDAHKGGVASLAFAPDGRMVTCGRDRATRLWDAGGKQLRQFELFNDIPMQTAFAGGKVIAGDWSGALRVWTLEGKRTGELDANPPTLAERSATGVKRVEQLETALASAAAERKQAESAAAKLSAEVRVTGGILQEKESAMKGAVSQMARLEKATGEAESALSKTQEEILGLEQSVPQLAQNSVMTAAAHQAAEKAESISGTPMSA